MIKRLLIFSSICSYAVVSAVQNPVPVYPQVQPRPMQSADTRLVYAALRRAQSDFKETPRYKQQLNSNWEVVNIKLWYGYDHVVAAAKAALKDKGLVVSQQHVSEPRPMVITFVVHPESGQFFGSEKVVPQYPNHSTPTQGQYNKTVTSAYVEAVGLEVPLDQLIETAESASSSGEAPQN